MNRIYGSAYSPGHPGVPAPTGQTANLSALPQIPRGQSASGEGQALNQRDVQPADQIIQNLSVMFVAFRDRKPTPQELKAFICKLDTLRKLGHASLAYFVREVKKAIPVPEAFIDEWLASKLSTYDFLSQLLQRFDGAPCGAGANSRNLTEGDINQIHNFLEIFRHTDIGESHQQTANVHHNIPARPSQGPSLQSLQQQAKDATRRSDPAEAFHAYQTITENFPVSDAARKAWLEMTWMCITNEFGADILSPAEIVEKLIEYTQAGDMGARVQLEALYERKDYREELRRQKSSVVLRDIEQKNNDEFERALNAPVLGEYRSFGSDDDWQPEFSCQESTLSQGDSDEIDECPVMACYLPSLAAVKRGELNGMASVVAQASIKPTQEVLGRNRSDAHISLRQRVRNWEAGHIGRFSQGSHRKIAKEIFIKTLTGGTIILRQVDMNGPVADLCMKLCEKGYPLCKSRLIFKGAHINNDENLYKELGSQGVNFTGSTVHLVLRQRCEVNRLNQALKCQRVDTPGGQITYVPLMPEKFNSTEKIERTLVSLYQYKRQCLEAGELTGVAEFLELRSCIQNALQCLAVGGGISSNPKLGIETLDSLSIYLDLVNRCLELYKTPFVDRQNSHITALIAKTLKEQQSIQQSIRCNTENFAPATCQVNFMGGKVDFNKQMLAARCSYIATLEEFSGRVQEIDFSKVCRSEKARDAFKYYLLSGDLKQVNQLTAAEVVSLFRVANQYQAVELEKQCLLLILEGIKYNLFTVEEMQEIMTFIVIDEIREAVSPLFEFQTTEQGGGPQSLCSLRERGKTVPRPPASYFDWDRRCLSLGAHFVGAHQS